MSEKIKIPSMVINKVNTESIINVMNEMRKKIDDGWIHVDGSLVGQKKVAEYYVINKKIDDLFVYEFRLNKNYVFIILLVKRNELFHLKLFRTLNEHQYGLLFRIRFEDEGNFICQFINETDDANDFINVYIDTIRQAVVAWSRHADDANLLY